MSRRAFLAAGAASVLVACSNGGSGSGDTAPVDGSAPAAGPTPFHYGDDRSQVADLWLPDDRPATGTIGVVVLLHGGYWRPASDRSLMDPLARDVIGRGWAAWNVDYRPVRGGDGGGGWPGTYVDVAAGVDLLAAAADDRRLDLDRVAVVGHSAGGCMALWSAARGGLREGAPGAGPKVIPALAVSLAGVNNLIAAVFEDLGDGAVTALMGAEPEVGDDRYLLASPVERLPIGVPQVLVHGADDPIVPVTQSSAYAAKAQEAKDEATLVVVPGADHFDVIDPEQRAWREVTTRLSPLLDP